MSIEFSERLDAVDDAQLTPFVQKVLKSEAAKIITWDIEPMSGGATQASGRSYGLYRFKGSAQIETKRVPWSLVLKATAGSLKVSHDPQKWNYWKREVLVYQSGLVADLPGNVVAPQCFGVTEYPGDEFWIWLEDIPNTNATWTLEDYGLAARHLGQFNGAYLVGKKPLPEKPWLSKGRVRDWLARTEPMLPNLAEASQHPLVQRWFNGDSVNRTLKLWKDRDVLLEAIDRLPRSFCHQDAFKRNLSFRQGAKGQIETVALDWEIAGIGAIGEEITTLVGISMSFYEFPATDAKALDAIVFEAYLKGLKEAGWVGDERLVRFGFAAITALFIGVGTVGPFMKNIVDDDRKEIVENFYGCSREEIADQFGLMQSYLLDLGDEARALLDVL